MGFSIPLLIRITLAVLGGVLYALLAYALILSPIFLLHSLSWLHFLSIFSTSAQDFFSFFLESTPLLSTERKGPSRPSPEKNSFQEAAQWVGKFYHQHDVVLIVFSGILSITFLVSVIMDGLGGNLLERRFKIYGTPY